MKFIDLLILIALWIMTGVLADISLITAETNKSILRIEKLILEGE